ncbi:nucleotidyltransferase domain-containing protein [Candidatus Woesearchaeota archaeon]|nr:nucleotidyltransferase domain-containing protein [Candidatus Woesearchaeota archaeon]
MLDIFNNIKLFMEDNYIRIGVREYARLRKISPPHASEILKNFQKEKLLLMEKERRHHLYHANTDSKLFIKLQRAFYQNEFRELTLYIESQFINPLVILFGSFSKAEISRNSDIDIAVFSSLKKSIDLHKFERKYGRKIHLFLFKDKEELDKNKELLHSILNGNILSGGW